MPYLVVDVDVDDPAEIRLAPDQDGVGIVARRADHVVGFSLHAVAAGSCIDATAVARLLDPDRRDLGPPCGVAAPAQTPTITVAICTRDRADLLRACVGGLIDTGVPPSAIVVVDNASTTDATRAVTESFGVRYVLEPCAGLDVARNRALRSCDTDVVAFVDDDIVPDRHWYTSLAASWARHPDAAVVNGQILPFELETDAQVAFERRGGFRGGNREVRFEGMELSGNLVYPYHPGMFGAGANMSVHRATVLAVHGFDEALDTGPPLAGGGDIDLMHRVIRAGYPLVYDPHVVVFHRHRRDAIGLLRQYESWGRATMAFAAKTYRLDPLGRPKLRRLVRRFFRTQLRSARDATRVRDGELRRAAIAEAVGGVAGLAGTYGRSRRRMARRRRRAAVPNVAIIPWGDVVEDYTAPIGLTLTDYLTALSGGWLFGYVQALASAGVTSTVVVWSSTVRRRQRCLHVPTGATVWVLPPSRTWRRLRPHIRGRWVAQPERGPVSRLARAVVPYAATTPFQLARVLREEACTSVLTQEYEEARFDVCVVLGRLLGLPVFATFQGGDVTRTRLERITRRPAVRAAAGFLVHDSREVGRLVARYGVDAERIARIPNPFDARTVPVVARGEARRRLGLTPADRVVAWHGRVDVTPKGIDVLVDAWEEISRRDGGAVLTLLGTGAGAPWLAERIRARELRGVRWRDEYVLDRDTVGAHLSAADVYVLPSRQEGLPVAIIEAMATGLPVVAADAPGVRDIIGSGDDAAGVVVPVEDPVALADAVLALLDDPDRRAALGERGRRRVDDELSLVAVGRALRDVLVAR